MNYYHVSSDNQDDKKFKPRIPDCRMDEEDGKTKRVCFSTSILGCLYAISAINYMNTDKIFYVHVPYNYKGKIHKPTIKQVPDVRITREKWFLNQVRLKCVGKIKIQTTLKNKMGVTFKWVEKYE